MMILCKNDEVILVTNKNKFIENCKVLNIEEEKDEEMYHIPLIKKETLLLLLQEKEPNKLEEDELFDCINACNYLENLEVLNDLLNECAKRKFNLKDVEVKKEKEIWKKFLSQKSSVNSNFLKVAVTEEVKFMDALE